MQKLRIVFMGTPEFAVASLRELVRSSHEVVGVVTVADKPAGRGQQIHSSPVKQFAVENNIPILQPLKLKDEVFLEELKALRADLFVVVAFRMLPEVVWNMPEKGTINLHGSLLPQYRGAAPINWAIINGEKETGVTTFFLQHEIDTGRVIRRQTIPIAANETAGELHDKMMEIGAKTLLETVNAIADGSAHAQSQEELVSAGEEVKHAPKIFKEDCAINWNQSGEQIHNFIRGLAPYPAAWTKLGEKNAKIYKGEFKQGLSSTPGTFITDNKTTLRIATADGWYHVFDLQYEGKKRMGVDEFLRGWRP